MSNSDDFSEDDNIGRLGVDHDTDLEILNDLFGKIKVTNKPTFSKKKINKKIRNMNPAQQSHSQQGAPQQQNLPINNQLLRMFVDTIPQYSGDQHTLEIFIDSCTYLIDTYTNFQNPNDPINTFLTRAIIGKLTDRAQRLIGTRTELRTWEEIKNALRLTFGDNRNIDCLVQDLIILKPFKNEPPTQFGARIQDALSLLISKLNSANLALNEKILHLNNYKQLALKTFIRGLTGRLQDMVRIRNPDSLENAIALVIEEQNFFYAQNRLNFNVPQPHTQNQRKPNTQFNPPRFNSPPTYREQTQNYPTPYYQPQTFQLPNIPAQRFPVPQFPRGPISNIRPNFRQSPHHYPTNQQVFGTRPPQTNVFKPTGRVPDNKPVPMSTTTRIPTATQKLPTHIPNFFRSTGPRNFTSQELFNVESETQNFESQYNQDYDQQYPYSYYENYPQNFCENETIPNEFENFGDPTLYDVNASNYNEQFENIPEQSSNNQNFQMSVPDETEK